MSGTFFDIDLRAPLARFELRYELATDERCVGVFGPSGAGKTTVLELVAGWRRPARGHVRIGGRTLYDSERGVHLAPRRRGVGYVPQDALLFPHWDVARNVLAGTRRAPERVVASDRVDRVLDALELGPLTDRPVGLLSGGERHRVALARALCSEPDVLLLDEPLASLDVRLKRRILTDLLRVRQEFDVPMLFISHDATEVQVLCDLAQCLRAGAVEAVGKPAVVLREATGPPGWTDYENVLRGTIASTSGATARLALASGLELLVPRSGVEPGERAILGVRADEILIATSEPRDISARNILPGRVESIHRGEEVISVQVALGRGEPPRPPREAPVSVNVTDAAVRDLDLRPGRDVFLLVKTHSLHVISSLPAPAG